MVEKHVSKFLAEVEKHSDKSFPLDKKELRTKAVKILEAFIFKNLKLQNPGTYSLVFLVNLMRVEFHSLHEVKCALSMLLDLISEGEYLDLPFAREANSTIFYSRTERSIRESFDVFEELFSMYPGRIDAIVKDLNRYSEILSEEGLKEQIKKFNDDSKAEIAFLENLLDDVLTWDDFRLYYGNEADVMIARLQRLLSAKIARQQIVGIRSEVEIETKEEFAYPEIFAPNGYRLFDSLVKSIEKKGRGFQAEVVHFFRLMEYDAYAKKGDTRFSDWFSRNYSDFPELGRMRLLKDFVGPSHEARERRYHEVKHRLKLK